MKEYRARFENGHSQGKWKGIPYTFHNSDVTSDTTYTQSYFYDCGCVNHIMKVDDVEIFDYSGNKSCSEHR